jgi:hypothetical protein
MSIASPVPADSVPAPGWSWGASPAGAAPGAPGGRQRAAASRARRRGAAQGAAGVAIAIAAWLVWRTPLAWLIAGISVGLALLALAAPLSAYARVSRALEALGRAVGIAVTWALMALVLYLLFLPVGLVLRARRSLRLTRGFDPAAPTYWMRPAERSGGADRYRKQF